MRGLKRNRGPVYVITRCRHKSVNLRTQFQRIIGRAGLAPWPKLFQTLRASRATELANEYPAHVAAAWLGHSTVVASKHYWQVTDADFEKRHEIRDGIRTKRGKTRRNQQPPPIEKPQDLRGFPQVFPAFRRKQWAMRGSNPRPPRCKCDLGGLSSAVISLPKLKKHRENKCFRHPSIVYEIYKHFSVRMPEQRGNRGEGSARGDVIVGVARGGHSFGEYRAQSTTAIGSS